MKTGKVSGLSEAGWVTSALLGTALAWDASGLDLPLAQLAGSAAGFPWRDHWLLAAVGHEAARRLAWLLALALCLCVWWPAGPLARITYTERLRLAVSVLISALAVSLLKLGSQTSCPWDLAQFGGLAQYTSHWSLDPDGGAGHCFPAGHASSGFAFAGGYFAFRRADPVLARRWLAGSLAAGATLGIAQQWRGAHFMSHTLWTAVVCWITTWIVSSALPRGETAIGS
jgi:membrane-associated PAP2 superfamily phosphatase